MLIATTSRGIGGGIAVASVEVLSVQSFVSVVYVSKLSSNRRSQYASSNSAVASCRKCDFPSGIPRVSDSVQSTLSDCVAK